MPTEPSPQPPSEPSASALVPHGRPSHPRRAEANRSRLRPAEKQAQAALIMMRRLAGDASLEQLSEEFNLDPRTIQRRLAQARTDGVLDQARKVFVSDMLPQAMVVLQEALMGEDLKLATDVAKHIITGLKAMEGAPSATITHTVEESFEHFRQRISVTGSATITSQPSTAPGLTEDLRVHSHEALPLCPDPGPAPEPAAAEAPDGEASSEGSIPPVG